MTEQHPITPPPELVQQWIGEFFGCKVSGELASSEQFLANRAAQWGADQELEACCEWLKTRHWIEPGFADELHAARRPKPQSLKEQALDQLTSVEDRYGLINTDYIRRALEQLDD
jgi:hypothetical protein